MTRILIAGGGWAGAAAAVRAAKRGADVTLAEKTDLLMRMNRFQKICHFQKMSSFQKTSCFQKMRDSLMKTKNP